MYSNIGGLKVIVTGGGRGLGSRIVEAFSREGGEVFVCDVEKDAR